MGNGNTRPQQGPTTGDSEAEEIVGFKRQPIPAVTPSTHSQGPSSQEPTALDVSSPTNRNKGCLVVAPSSNPGPPRIVFSASLERTLSSRKNKKSAFRSSSSWTEGGGHLGNASSPLPLSSQQRQHQSEQRQQQSEGEGAAGGLTKSTTRGGGSVPRSTGEDKKAKGKIQQWKKGFRGHQHQSSGVGGAATTTKSPTVSCPRDSDLAAKAGVPATAVIAGASRGFSREEGAADQTTRRRSRTHWGRPKQQEIGDISCSSKGREASCPQRGGSSSSARGKLPMVKCWEGRTEKEGDVIVEESRTPRRSFRGQSHAETSLRRPKITNSTTPSSEGRPNAKVEGSTTSSRVVGRGERVAFGRAFTERVPTQHRGRGGEARSARDDLVATDDDERLAEKIAPLQLPLAAEEGDTYADCEGNQSLSSASSVTAQGVSVSLLPPMGTTTTVAADLIFEDSSFEDSGASASLASSSERNTLDIGDASGAGGSGDCATGMGTGGGGAGRRKRIAPAPRQRSGSVDAFVRTRSVGRGLSNLKARIHEQEESKGKDISFRTPVLRDRRSSSRERFRSHELSDSDDGSPGAGAAVTPLTVTTPWAAVTPAASTLNIGHQRAALELRNLTLEREVEQLKTHLQNMGGDGIDRQRQGLHRPRPRPRRTGEQAMTHRLVAPLPLSDAPRSIPRRSGAGAGGGWAGAHGTARDKAQSDRVRLQSSSHRGGGGRDSVGTSPHPHTGRSVPAPTALAEESRANAVQSSPSPPRRYDRRPSDARPSVGTVITVAPVEPSSGSPARQLRASKLRSPEPTSQGAAATTDASRGYTSRSGVAVGPFMSLSKVKAGQAGQEGANRGGRLDTDAAATAARQTDHGMMTNDRTAVSDTGRIPAQEPTRICTEARPLPRLRAEGAERRRGALKKARASKAPVYLGGVVSGIKHTFLGRRRSTGAINAQNIAPAESYSANVPAAGSGNSGSRGTGSGQAKRKGEARDAPANTTVVDTPTPAPVEDNASPTKQAEGDEKTRAPRRPRRGEDSSLALSSSSATMTAAAAAAAAAAPPPPDASPAITPVVNDHQRGREELAAGLEGGVREGKGTPEASVVNTTATDRTTETGVPVATTRTETVFEADVEASSTPIVNSKEKATVAAAAEVVKVTAATGSAEVGEEAPGGGRWPATLDARWAEVEFMLCHEIESEESLQHTIEATKAGLVFMDKLENKAQELGVLKGQLSRWLLPFNADTSVDEQQAATPRRFQESLQASSASFAAGDGVLTEEEAEYLTAGARKVRQLIRLKIADDNDLNTAKEALVAMAGFFVSISEEAERRGGSATAFGILQERRAMSPITRPPPLPSMFRPSMEASVATKEVITDTQGILATATATATPTAADTATVSKRRIDAPITTGRRTPSLIVGSTKTASGETAGLTLAQAEGPMGELASAVEARDPEGSASSPSSATTPATPKPASRVDAAARSFSIAAHAAVEITTVAAATAAAASGAAAATSEAGAVMAPSPATAATTTSVAATGETPSAEPKDTVRRGGKKTEGGAASGEERRAGGSIKQVRGDRSGRSTDAAVAGAAGAAVAATATAMATSSSADAPRGDSSTKEAALLPTTREQGSSGYGVAGEVVGVAPPGSLVRLKKRRQQARARSSNQR